ncbi:MAG: thioredoxin [Magnetococcales bacterium]|nr:thioredoxin [Magnetococcales bacterium]
MAAGETDCRAQVLQAPSPVRVDFWAPWCGPLRAMAPVLETIAKEYAGRIKVVKVNTEENRDLAKQYAIQAIPTLMLFDKGKLKEPFVGALPVQQLRVWIGKSMGWL